VYLLGADKSLTRPGRKQARKHVREAHDFNNIETRDVIKILFFLQGRAPNEIHAALTETLACFLPGRVTTYQHPCIIKNWDKYSVHYRPSEWKQGDIEISFI